MRLSIALCWAALVPHSLVGQDGTAAAARTISEADVRRRIQLVAHDSMGGRDTPSRGLDLTAAYLAAEFKRAGLKRVGSNADIMTRFPITTSRVEATGSTVSFSGAGQQISLRIGTDAVVALGLPSGTHSIALAAGPIDSTVASQAKGRAVVWIADWSKGFPGNINEVVGSLVAGSPVVILPVNQPAIFSQLVAQGGPERRTVGGAAPGPAVVVISDSAVFAQYPDARAQFDQLRAATTPTVVTVDEWSFTADIRETLISADSAPNVAAVLEGSDPELKNEYLVFSAHMDHVGSECQGSGAGDAICNGADDDASGTAGLVELAEAFAAGPRPKRSVIFLGVSGEEKGLWGSRIFADNPPVPIRSIVANLNMDMIGRNWKDTVVAIGIKHSDLGETLLSVAAANRDLGITPVDDLWPQERLYYRSDHYNFARRGVPVLFFTSGLHADYHAVSDSPDKIDAEKEARILRLVYHLGLAVANQTERPKWNPESYRTIVQPQDQVP